MREIIEDRYNRGLLIITNQTPIDRWYEFVGDRMRAGTIRDGRRYISHHTELRSRRLWKPDTNDEAD